MEFGRAVRRTLRDVSLPSLFLLLTVYFLWNATQGDRGLQATAQRQDELKAARAELDRAEADVATWQRRVNGLRDTRLDRDALDERARAMLNLSEPDDVIVPYGKGERLF